MKTLLRRYSIPLLIGTLSELLFLLFQARGIFGGDSGDVVTAAFTFGIPHPPGYPLYTFLGWVLGHIPLFSPAWRIGLLSSLPHAFVVALVYLTVVRLTKTPLIGLFSALAILGNYVFFLYSITPEVFALFDLFIVCIVYLLVSWQETKKSRYLLWTAGVIGLSFTHHQVILFFVPAIGYWIWIHRSHLRGVSPFTPLVYFFLGLIPFFYIPLAARAPSIINWDRPVDLSGFIRLVTRADYGTFVSGGFYGAHLIERFLQVKGYGELLAVDVSFVGIFLLLSGFYWLWRTNRSLFFFFVLAFLFFGPIFFFYASFPLFNRFNWGTYERFLLPSYMILYPVIGLGLAQWTLWIRNVWKHNAFLWKSIVNTGFICVLCIYPLSMLGISMWRFVGLPQDETANNLGRDILQNLPEHSVVLMSRDTPLFTSQYVRYALRFRPDVALLHANKLSLSDYPPVVHRLFPDLVIPTKTGPTFIAEFIKANSTRPIFANSLLPVEHGWFWVPHGLVYALTPENSLPTMTEFYEQNTKIWDSFHDPARGILSRYNHLMLSDVRDVYESSRIDFAKTMLKAGKLDEAKHELEAALRYGGDTQTSDAYMLLGLTELFGNHCELALANFTKARETSMAPEKELTLYEGVTYRDCAKDAATAKKYLDEYERLRKSEETQLE